MAGNVWEWTHNLLMKYPYKAGDGRENEDASGSRVLRGGSFIHDVRFARCACRYDLVFGNFLDLIGFRVVVASHAFPCFQRLQGLALVSECQ